MSRQRKTTQHPRPDLGAFLARHGLALNAQQMAAAARVDGPTLLLAVPGSGKTTVIICRLAYMIQACGIPAEHILSLTFSRAGAADLSNRYHRLFGDAGGGTRFSTIHSFALRVIRTYERRYRRRAFEVLDQTQPVLREIYKQIHGTFPTDADMADIESALTLARNQMLDEEAIAELMPEAVRFPQILARYEAAKKWRRVMDFDDILRYAYSLMKKYPTLRAVFARRYRYINLDEAQDTSPLQWAILRLLTGPNGHFFVVGDEDQSIYGFRGASPEMLLHFKDHYPQAKVLLMETNHRSTAELVAASDRFIALNRARTPKHMVTDNPKGVPPVHQWVKSAEEGHRFLLAAVRNEGKETAILYRNNESALPLVDLFEREGVRYRLKEHRPLFFSHFTVLDIRDFFALAKDPTDRGIFARIYYKMDCGLSRQQMAAAKQALAGQSVFDALLALPGLPEWQTDKIAAEKKGFARLKTMAPGPGIRLILDGLGYEAHLQFRIERGYREESIRQKLKIIRILAGRAQTQTQFLNRLDELAQIVSSQAPGPAAGVTLSTIHASKGLEFDKVYVIDAVEGEFPSRAALEDSPEGRALFAEEVRLFYVGATRARRELEFVSVSGPDAPAVSRFVRRYMGEEEKPAAQPKKKRRKTLGELGADYLAHLRREKQRKRGTSRSRRWHPGDVLIHRRFGRGQIASVAGQTAAVRFETAGKKKIDLALCETRGLIHKGQ
ncbi:ATP-dependent helicase [Pseudoramibacter alactolyticus]|uniref:ATP-dependent helicase n=1 Tax=Pseudoramibacter alactolyticus TaxID=113287 RepID=UPI0023570C3C|nr:UvrD-helicase domain-containing protein [Pseudoramibacter alactolyticus]